MGVYVENRIKLNEERAGKWAVYPQPARLYMGILRLTCIAYLSNYDEIPLSVYLATYISMCPSLYFFARIRRTVRNYTDYADHKVKYNTYAPLTL